LSPEETVPQGRTDGPRIVDFDLVDQRFGLSSNTYARILFLAVDESYAQALSAHQLEENESLCVFEERILASAAAGSFGDHARITYSRYTISSFISHVVHL